LSIIIADREIERLLTMGRFIVTETVRIERENEQERRRRRQERNND
jgi:hypothetical protein